MALYRIQYSVAGSPLSQSKLVFANSLPEVVERYHALWPKHEIESVYEGGSIKEVLEACYANAEDQVIALIASIECTGALDRSNERLMQAIVMGAHYFKQDTPPYVELG